MFWLLFILLCIAVGWFSYKKYNRNFFIWSISAFLFSPLFTILVLLFLENFIYTSPEKFSREILDIYKLYKNGFLDEKEYKIKKENLIYKLKTSNPDNFLVKITPLIQNSILDENEIQLIKRKLYE